MTNLGLNYHDYTVWICDVDDKFRKTKLKQSIVLFHINWILLLQAYQVL